MVFTRTPLINRLLIHSQVEITCDWPAIVVNYALNAKTERSTYGQESDFTEG